MTPSTPDDEGPRYNTGGAVTRKEGHVLNFPRIEADGAKEKVAGPAQEPVAQVETTLDD